MRKIIYNLEDFQKNIEYEKWVLQEIIASVETNTGATAAITVEFKPDGTKNHSFIIEDTLGSGRREKVLSSLSAMLFTLSYKCIDMIFELILKSNNIEFGYQYESKINAYEANSSDIVLPRGLREEPDITKSLFSIYEHFRVHRNKVIHGAWGYCQSGNLNFDFKHSNRVYKDKVDFKEIINLCVLTLTFVELILENKENAYLTHNIMYLFDKSPNLYKGNKFNVIRPRLYNIVYYLTGDKINLEDVRKYLLHENWNQENFYFSLTVMSTNTRWELPAEFLNDKMEIEINESLDEFRK